MHKTIAVVDQTGRGHAVCSALIDTNPDLSVHYIPGTGGVFDERITPVPGIQIDDAEAIAQYCAAHQIGFVVVMHIDALKAGVADILRASGLLVMGPSAKAVQIESSKWFCKSICDDAGIATPKAKLFDEQKAFIAYLKTRKPESVMIKADWLTSNGNGAFLAEAEASVDQILDRIGRLIDQNPGSPFRFLVEPFLPGADYSAHFLVNDQSIIELPSSQDFKMSHDGDQGQNCDGMASLSPHPLESANLQQAIRTDILEPMLASLRARGISYNGPIYLGLRVDKNGKPHLIEVNARMGDSEAEVIFPRIAEDLSAVFEGVAQEAAINRALACKTDKALVLSVVTGPEHPCRNASKQFESDWPNCNSGGNKEITYSPEHIVRGGKVFWANVTRANNGHLVTKTGRIAHIVGLGSTMAAACSVAYGSLRSVNFDGKRWRSDIGSDLPLNFHPAET